MWCLRSRKGQSLRWDSRDLNGGGKGRILFFCGSRSQNPPLSLQRTIPVQTMRWLCIFGMPVLLLLYLLMQLLGRRVETQETRWLDGDAKCAETDATHSVSAALCSLRIVRLGFFIVRVLDSKESSWYNSFCSLPLASHSTTDQRAYSLGIFFTPPSLFLVAPPESLCVCVWQNSFEKLGSGNEELQRDCISAGWASCRVRALSCRVSYLQGFVCLLFSMKSQSVHLLLPSLGQWVHQQEVKRIARCTCSEEKGEEGYLSSVTTYDFS